MITQNRIMLFLCVSAASLHSLNAETIDLLDGKSIPHRLPKLTIIPRLAVYSFQAKTADINGPVTINGPVRVDGTLLINGRPLTSSGLTEIPLSIANGGTNATSMANVDGVVYYDGTKLNTTTAGTTNTVLLGNTGAAPSFGTVPNAALANSTIAISGGSGITVTGSPVSLGGTAATIAITAPVSIANGGTNATSMNNTDGVVYFDGTRLNTTTVGTSGQLLTSNGTGNAPTFQTFTISTPDNSGSVTGNSLTLTAAGSGSTVKFNGSGTTITLALTDTTNSNIAIGNTLATGPQSNTIVGIGSQGGNSTGNNNNSVFGANAMSHGTTGSGNCAFGASTMSGGDSPSREATMLP